MTILGKLLVSHPPGAARRGGVAGKPTTWVRGLANGFAEIVSQLRAGQRISDPPMIACFAARRRRAGIEGPTRRPTIVKMVAPEAPSLAGGKLSPADARAAPMAMIGRARGSRAFTSRRRR